TVRQVVEMGRAPWARTPLEDDDNAVDRAMTATDTADLADRVFNSLSGGEQAHLSLAQVLAQGTRAVFPDSPSAALACPHQALVLGSARERAAAAHAALVVLHDLDLAAAYADRAAVLARRRIAAAGAPTEVLDSTLLSEVYQHAVEVLHHP